jgi:hypothetical protein
MDPAKLYRNIIGPEAHAAQKDVRDAFRGMMGRPAAERADVAAKLRIYAFTKDENGETTPEDQRQQALLMAATLSADVDQQEIASRIRAIARTAGLQNIEPCIERTCGPMKVAGFDAQRSHYDSAVWLSNTRAFIDTDDDCRALEKLLESMEPGRAEHLSRLLCDLTARTSMFWDARWGLCAFPVVTFTNVQYAASLCTTTMPAEFAKDVRAPWRAFMIRMPQEELLSIDAPSGVTECAKRICAQEHLDGDGERVWSYVVESDHTMIDRTCVPVAEMCVQADPEESDDRETDAAAKQMRKKGTVPTEFRNTARDWRTQHMAARLIVGVCMSFGVEGLTRRVGLVDKSRRRKQPFPTKREYIVGRPVRVNATQYVRDYIAGASGKRGPRTTQTLTRGHWKNQPHGPRSELRKFIHIEPYWSGPSDGPIVVRPHILNRGPQAAE